MDSVLELEEVLDRFGGDWELLREVVALFLESYAGLVEDVRTAVGRRDGGALQQSAHALKGTLSNFSRAAAAAALRLETMAKAGELEGCEAAFAALEDELGTLVPHLAALVTERVC